MTLIARALVLKFSAHFLRKKEENCKSYLPYLDRNLSWLEQYSCQINFIRNTWNTKIRNPIENQNIAGRPRKMENEKLKIYVTQKKK